MKAFKLLALTSCVLLAAGNGVAQQNYSKSEGLLQYVDPYIGSGYHGHVFVGTSVPYGMVQLGPTNIHKGWDWCSGYHYSDSILIGFSHTHLSGTGCTDLCDILIMPLNEIRTPRGNQDDIRDGYASRYSHANEIARPEYYSLLLDRYNIKAELTATDRVGFHRYTYPEGKPASILIDLREGNGSNAYDSYIRKVDDYTVVELSTMLAGPMTARLLAEWGADVIKVESMNGDPWRKQYGTSLSPYTEHANPNFDMQNINKRFVAFNMRTPEGKEAMMKLLATADVFLTNYRVQALEQMGLTYDQLKDQFPKLVHASVLGYGSEGAEKNRPGYDYTAFCARTGFLRDFAPAGGPPIMTVAGVGDHSVAISLAGGIAAALFKRTKTGVGDKVDVSLLQMGTYIFTCGILNGFNGREYPRDRYNCAHACSNTYQGKDGEWIYLAIVDYRRFPEFCGCIGHPELAEDPRFSTQNAYYANKADLTKILDEVFKEQTVEYWHKILNDHDLPHEICYHFKDVPYDEQVQANHYTYFHEYQDGTKTVFTNGPVHFASIDPAKIPCRESRNVGSDTKEILEELGYSDDKIQKMYEGKDIR